MDEQISLSGRAAEHHLNRVNRAGVGLCDGDDLFVRGKSETKFLCGKFAGFVSERKAPAQVWPWNATTSAKSFMPTV